MGSANPVEPLQGTECRNIAGTVSEHARFAILSYFNNTLLASIEQGKQMLCRKQATVDDRTTYSGNVVSLSVVEVLVHV